MSGLRRPINDHAHYRARQPDRAAPQIPRSISSFAAQPFVLFPRQHGADVYDAILAACRAAGFSPIRGVEAPQLSSMINLVAAGMGVSLVPASMMQVRVHGVGYRPIAGNAPLAQLLLPRRAADRSETLARFVQVARGAVDASPP